MTTSRATRAAIAGCACTAALLCGAATAGAQQQAAKSNDWLVGAAVLAAPPSLREGAEVRRRSDGDRFTVLRKGSNHIICLADLAEDEEFAAACYHDSLEPFMERGRELRRQGIAGARRDSLRNAEIDAGKLAMPASAMVYNLRFPSEDFDPATADPATGGRLHAFYIRGATTESTGVPSQPGDGPWLMNAGGPAAHIMIALPVKRTQ